MLDAVPVVTVLLGLLELHEASVPPAEPLGELPVLVIAEGRHRLALIARREEWQARGGSLGVARVRRSGHTQPGQVC
jgi:hypothetical protein